MDRYRGSRLLVAVFLAVNMFVLGFASGMIVAGHTDWECKDQSSDCYEGR